MNQLSPEHLNRLAGEQSPYLLQHAHNPVDWYPWGEEAFHRAEKEDKPVFLSIGYATCHWCHVMERESFEDEETARLMNEAFVCIKVDREERPDIDGVYMTACQMLTGSGGWPLTIIMTPDKKPFFAATYIPRETRFGRIGMLDLVPRIQDLWRTRRGDVASSAAEISEAIAKTARAEPGAEPGEEILDRAYRELERRFDRTNGGFSRAPKFPTPHNLLFLLRRFKLTGERRALEMVEHTLGAMRRGGVYDHVGFGFHRYSTDPEWLVPHFEKMLYDQALLGMAYVEAFQATGREDFAATAREVYTYVLRDMTAPEGGFYSAEDADSEGREGKFYVWTRAEFEEVLSGALGAEGVRQAAEAFQIAAEGNFTEEATGVPTGENIPHLKPDSSAKAAARGSFDAETAGRIETARRALFAHREKRVHPLKDDKILTDWNGLMIASLAKAARALGEPAYAEAARRAADFVLAELRSADGRLLHRFRGGEAGLPAHADDYAFMMWGLIELYETAFDPADLEVCTALERTMHADFWDHERGGYFFTANGGEGLPARMKEIYDGAIPSANSVAMLNLLRLARITGDAKYEERAARIGRAFSRAVGESPSAFTMFLSAASFAAAAFSDGPAAEVVIAGDPDSGDTRAMVQAVRSGYRPFCVVILRSDGADGAGMARVAPFTSDLVARGGVATAYVCRRGRCSLPATDIETMMAELETERAGKPR